MDSNGIWQTTHTIDAAVVDLNGRLRMPQLCNYLQVAAIDHAEFHGMGFSGMQAMGKYWVLNRLRVEMSAWPQWSDAIQVQTWVQQMKGPFSYRHFRVLNAAGQRLGAASTLWVAIDAERGRLARISPKGLPVREDLPADCTEPDKLPAMPISATPYTYRVAYSDLDLLRHVNNAKYIEWLFNSYPLTQHEKAPKTLTANYLRETHHGDTIHIHTDAQAAPTIRHEITLPDGTPLLRAQVVW